MSSVSFESSSEDPMDYLRTKDSEKEPLLGGKVAAAPPGKYARVHVYWYLIKVYGCMLI